MSAREHRLRDSDLAQRREQRARARQARRAEKVARRRAAVASTSARAPSSGEQAPRVEDVAETPLRRPPLAVDPPRGAPFATSNALGVRSR